MRRTGRGTGTVHGPQWGWVPSNSHESAGRAQTAVGRRRGRCFLRFLRGRLRQSLVKTGGIARCLPELLGLRRREAAGSSHNQPGEGSAADMDPHIITDWRNLTMDCMRLISCTSPVVLQTLGHLLLNELLNLALIRKEDFGPQRNSPVFLFSSEVTSEVACSCPTSACLT